MNEKEIEIYMCIKDFHMIPECGGERVFTAGKFYYTVYEGFSTFAFEDDKGDEHFMDKDDMKGYLIPVCGNGLILDTSKINRQTLIEFIDAGLIKFMNPIIRRNLLELWDMEN